MSIDRFESGKSFSGVLLTYEDGEQHTLPTTLRFIEETGVEFEVSHGSSVFVFTENPDHPSVWFRGDASIPAQCVFMSLEGNLTLSHIRCTQRKSNAYVSGAKFVAGEAVFRATGTAIDQPAPFEELVSRVDGLAEWWNAKNVVTKHHKDGLGRSNRMEITTREDIEPIVWLQNGAEMRIDLGWRTETSDGNRSWTMMQLTNLSSTFPDPRPADDHLNEHHKIKSLLALMSGKSVAYREHEIRNKDAYYEDFPALEERDAWRHVPRVHFVTTRTVRDYARERRKQSDFRHPVLSLSQIGHEGLGLWADAWDKDWERLISPTIAVLDRPRPFIEDRILATGIFLDAWGKRAPKAEGERDTYSTGRTKAPTFATFVYRALAACDADWTSVATSMSGLSISIRRIYTAIKHAENELPDPTEMALISRVMLLIVRMVAARKVDLEGSSVREFGRGWGLKHELRSFADAGLVIDEAGNFTSKEATAN